MHAIEALSLSKRFGNLQALSQVDFTVSEGETFGFLGPNGAGKTTTIRILTGMSAPTEGTARIFGRDIVQESLARGLRGIVPVHGKYSGVRGRSMEDEKKDRVGYNARTITGQPAR
ncbi:MAG: ATP-binding cassette domain-containing protein [Methanomicrobiales archaeon]